MPFSLRITFSGLCLFAPDFERRDPRVHVLLMNFGNDSPTAVASHAWHAHGDGAHDARALASGVPKHFAMLYFDAAYRFVDSAEESGHLLGVPLRDCALTLDGPDKVDPKDPALRRDILDIATVSDSGPLARRWVEPAPARAVASRVTLLAGTRGRDASVSSWHVEPSNGADPTEARITDRPEWYIPNVDSTRPLRLSLEDLDDEGVTRRALPPLHPIRDQIRLHVCCLPLTDLPGGEIPDDPQEGEPAEHFEGFFLVFPGVQPPRLTLTRPSRTGTTTRCTAALVDVR